MRACHIAAVDSLFLNSVIAVTSENQRVAGGDRNAVGDDEHCLTSSIAVYEHPQYDPSDAGARITAGCGNEGRASAETGCLQLIFSPRTDLLI